MLRWRQSNWSTAPLYGPQPKCFYRKKLEAVQRKAAWLLRSIIVVILTRIVPQLIQKSDIDKQTEQQGSRHVQINA